MQVDQGVLFVAAGGGGDALAAQVVASALAIDVRATATFAWERKIFDPRPGPRVPRDFASLERVGAHNWRIHADTRLLIGRSFLPATARAFGTPLFLLDPSGGASRIRRQLQELASIVDARAVVVVDVGGDVLARGDEVGLRSPLADALALAGACDLNNVYVMALGLGLDGELSGRETRQVVREATRRGWCSSEALDARVAERFRHHFSWSPSEATALACLAAVGWEGDVEVRGEGLTVTMNRESAAMHRFDYEPVLERNLIAQALLDTTSLAEADAAVRAFRGLSEIDLETAVVDRRRRSCGPGFSVDVRGLQGLEAELLAYGADAVERGVKFLTQRRIAEILDIRGPMFEWFRRYLRRSDPERFIAPVWSCTPRRRRLTSPRFRRLH